MLSNMTPAFFAPLRAFQVSSNPQDINSETGQCVASSSVPNHTFRVQTCQSLADAPKLQSHSPFNLSTKPPAQTLARPSLDLKPGIKRLPSNAGNPDGFLNMFQEDHQKCPGQSCGDENGDESELDRRFEKRHRTSDWPLKGASSKENLPGKAPLRNRSRGNGSSTSSHKPNLSKLRSSRFLEGSMNDRVSRKPHSSYVGADEETELPCGTDQVEPRGQMQKHQRGITHYSNSSMASGSLAENSDTSRHSSIFRFGKSLSAAFNPSSWKIWPTKSQEFEDSNRMDKIIRGRREMAEQTYQNMKLNGQFQEFSNGSAFKFMDSDQRTAQHDLSAIFSQRVSVGSGARARKPPDMMVQEERQGMVFLERASVSITGRSDSPSYEERASPHKASFHFKKPSLQNLGFASNFQQEAPANNSTQNLDSSRLPSRKDLQKQQKLVKKVSDLEGKLETARRQLAEALTEPIPDVLRTNNRLRFKGILATLPSESCLLGLENSTENDEDIGKAVSTDNYLKLSLDEEMEPYQSVSSEPKSLPRSPSPTLAKEQQLNILPSIEQPLADCSETTGISAHRESATVGEAPESTDVLRTHQASKKRKGIGLDEYRPSAESDDDDDVESEDRTEPLSLKQKNPRGKKLQKTGIPPHTSETVTSVNKIATIGLGRTIVVNRRAQPMNKIGSRIPRRDSGPTSVPPPSVKAILMGTSSRKNAMHGDEKDQEGSFSAFPIESEDHPVPNIPMTVKLASGAVVRISGKAIPTLSAVSHTGNAVGSMNSTMSGGDKEMGSPDTATKVQKVILKRDESFEWPEDIF